MNQPERFYEAVHSAMAVTLATASGDSVTMRAVSPVVYDGAILIFTSADSVKYRQLAENPHCCIGVEGFFAQASAEFLGKAMAGENAEYRKAYCDKFPKAFDEDASFGARAADFILLKPIRLTGWAFENDLPTEDGIPTIPFSCALE